MSALRALAVGLIDFAGLFPPASLPMREAWNDFRRHRASSASWMLGRFICPAARLDELAACVTPQDGDLPLALLASRGGAAGLAASLARDGQAWESFAVGQAGRAHAEAWELRLPDDAPVGEDLDAALLTWTTALSQGIPLFWEAGPDWPEARLDELARTLQRLNREHGARHGLKLRCGGTRAAEFPPVDTIARMLVRCRDNALPLKCTAGLHHPLRHWCPEVGVWMHGFLNLWIAGLAAQVHGWSADELIPVLSEGATGAFLLEEDSLTWRHLRVDAARVLLARTMLVGQGSCSFDEPVADMIGMGWLPSDVTRAGDGR